WADSAFHSTVITAVFPPFFAEYAAAGLSPVEATTRFAWTTTAAVTIVAILSPVLGALADYRPYKKRLMAIFMAVSLVAVVGMGAISQGAWVLAAVLFLVANVGERLSWVFYDSLLPHVARPEEADRVSTAGF